jgi:hypothetical protein
MTPFLTLPHGFAMTRRLSASAQSRRQVLIFARGNSTSIAIGQFLLARLVNVDRGRRGVTAIVVVTAARLMRMHCDVATATVALALASGFHEQARDRDGRSAFLSAGL